jgi:PAP2 superfamily
MGLRFLKFLVIGLAVLALSACCVKPAKADSPEAVIGQWYGQILRLVRHTPDFSPPVASRSFAYFGTTVYEALASGDAADMQSLAGQVHGLKAVPPREKGKAYDDAVVLNAAMAEAAKHFFSHTGPSGQRAMEAFEKRLLAEVTKGVKPAVAKRSAAYGKAISNHILAWSAGDGGANVVNMGFPRAYTLNPAPGHWVPTSTIGLQQVPLLPDWGENRTFVLPDGATCDLPPPPVFSTDKGSDFFKQAQEVYDVAKNRTPEQKDIARFWSDDPMLSPTPPGHWVSIALQIFARDKVPAKKQADVLARLGMAIADGFIGCWHTKYEYDLVRPVSFIKKVIDPKFETLLITPPFPEYPSGHSSQSGAAAEVMTQAFGANFAFTDATHIQDNIAARNFASFDAAAQEAAMSRLYGGIHFRAAVEQGLVQGACIGKYVNGLKTLR